MIEEDLTPNLTSLLILIEDFASRAIRERGTFDPYGILLKRTNDAFQMVFLEALDDSNEVLKGLPAAQMGRQIEDLIHQFRNDLSVESAALVKDVSTHLIEGGEESDAVMAWLDDRGRQAVRVMIFYELNKGIFTPKEKIFEPRETLFLPRKEDVIG
jgi:hypothetical protein